jgi:hypothetical protein
MGLKRCKLERRAANNLDPLSDWTMAGLLCFIRVDWAMSAIRPVIGNTKNQGSLKIAT